MNETLRIDNDRDELYQILGEDFLNCTLTPVPFPDGMTVDEFWKTSHQGIYMLLTKSEKQPADSASVHITIVNSGQIKHATAALLKKPLVGVQHVILENEPVN